MASEHLERELKYDATPAVVMPDLAGSVPDGGRIERGAVTLSSSYFDTDSHDLLEHGVTLRSRAGTTDEGWQLKVPAGNARIEIRLEPTDTQTTVPDELSSLVTGIGRGKPLQHIVTIRTDRTVHRVLDATGQLVVEVADDQVDAVAPGERSATLTNWREIEAELGPAGTEDILSTVDGDLVQAGAVRSTSPNKVAKALGTEGNASPPSAQSTTQTAGDVIRAYLAEQDDALITGDLTLRRGLGGIHPTRVATRRLRSTLRVFADFFDQSRAEAFDSELSWYAALLGDVRDREVQRARFAGMIADLSPEQVMGPVAARIEQHLLTEQLQHQQTLDKEMNGDRYLALLTESARWVTDPPFTALADDKPTVLRGAVRSAARKVTKHLAAGLEPTGTDTELHKARKAGKRARYAAELAGPVLGNKTKKAVDQYKELQDILGDLQDGVFAADLLRRLAAGTAPQPAENGFTYGLLYAQELRRAQESRQNALDWAKRL